MSVHVSEFVVSGTITACRLASTANISAAYDNGSNGVGATLTTSASTLSVDTIAVENNDYIFVTEQTNAYENGIYVVSGVGIRVVLTRRADFQSPSQMVPGFYFSISAGTLAGSIISIIEPQIQEVGVDTLATQSVGGGVVPVAPTSVNLDNDGLNVYNPAGTFLNHIVPTSAITANRTFSLVTGNQNTSLDLSLPGTLAPSVYGASLVAASGFGTAQTLLNISAFGSDLVAGTALQGRGVMGIINGITTPATIAATSNAFAVTGVVSTMSVCVSMHSSTTPVNIVSVVAGAGIITVTWDGAPGANTSINYIAVATV